MGWFKCVVDPNKENSQIAVFHAPNNKMACRKLVDFLQDNGEQSLGKSNAIVTANCAEVAVITEAEAREIFNESIKNCKVEDKEEDDEL